MDAQKQMKIVNNIMGDICEKLGNLTRLGVFAANDSIEIIKELNTKHYEWMTKEFDANDIQKFAANLMTEEA